MGSAIIPGLASRDLTIYLYRNIKKASCPRGVLPEASWSGAGSAPAAGADACSGLGRPKANSGVAARLRFARPTLRWGRATALPADRDDPVRGEAEAFGQKSPRGTPGHRHS